ncbi:MAG: hypothetical protein LBR81_08800 [Prevotellaceae bacterium]|jgi:hypothetical protein|nr:hypothetical protein [Prevotellaceae bacterium]
MQTQLSFSKNLFWDIDLSDLDMEKHAAYIVDRVLDLWQMGRLAIDSRLLWIGTNKSSGIEVAKYDAEIIVICCNGNTYTRKSI